MDNDGLKRETRDGAYVGPSSRRDSADRPVLVAIDLASSSEDAVIWACKHASHVGASLVVLHVAHEPADEPGFYKSGNGDLLEPKADAAERALTTFLDKVASNHPVLADPNRITKLCVSGLPATQILNAINDQDAQLLVLGGRHRNSLQRLVHGSIADQVIRQVSIPVTVVKEEI